ncbi:MAG: cytidine deaminase [Halodesulfurarchaeum sp.]
MDQLLDRAREALNRAVVPYSAYPVGAAIETASGDVYTGANIEIANYSNSLHAEEVALARAVMDGHTEFTGIAVSTAGRDGTTPCGMCRQTLVEFAGPSFEVLVDGPDGPVHYELGELLPAAFTGEQLGD